MTAFYSNKTVLVTGVGGFLGGHLVETLLACGAKVIGLEYKPKTHSYLVYEELDQQIRLYQCDITDLKELLSIVEENRIEYIFHCAGKAILSDCTKNPVACFDANVMGTVNILEAARQYDFVKGVVCMESYKLYGSQVKEDLPYNEDQIIRPFNIYEMSKAAANYVVKGYQQNFDVPVMLVRLANLYGPGDMNIRIVPQSILKVLEGEAPVLYSKVEHYIREFLYVKDAVDAICRLMAKIDVLSGEIVNLGSGSTHSVKEVVEMIIHILKSDLRPKKIDKQLEYKEIDEQYLDLSKLNSLLPEFHARKMVEGLEETIKWYQTNLQRIKSSKAT